MSIKMIARLGGLLYLINIVFGIFSIGYVASVIIVSGNASATAQNIITHEYLYRLGLAAHVIVLLTNVPLAIVFYRLFKIVSRPLVILVIFLYPDRNGHGGCKFNKSICSAASFEK